MGVDKPPPHDWAGKYEWLAGQHLVRDLVAVCQGSQPDPGAILDHFLLSLIHHRHRIGPEATERLIRKLYAHISLCDGQRGLHLWALIHERMSKPEMAPLRLSSGDVRVYWDMRTRER